MKRRAIIIVLDSVGVGAQPDAAAYGDDGANTLLHLYLGKQPHLPNLEKRGYLHVVKSTADAAERLQLPELPPVKGAYGRALATAAGKDTTTGHWEIAGAVLHDPMPTYPHGFPAAVLDAFKTQTGRGVLANIPASGTEIIKEYGEAHMKTGDLIVYTSADSVFQIAAHESIVPIDALYRYCQIARNILKGKHAVGRVIARPFEGTSAADFTRTSRRHDYSLEPPVDTMLDNVKATGQPVVSVGKISDIFAARGVTDALASKSNDMGVTQTLAAMDTFQEGLIFTNLVEFDMIFGHRNDADGYASALEAFDKRLPEIEAKMTPSDLLIITADHGCDVYYPGTDHTRESVPVIAYTTTMSGPIELGVRDTFADIGATVCDWLGARLPEAGVSFADRLS